MTSPIPLKMADPIRTTAFHVTKSLATIAVALLLALLPSQAFAGKAGQAPIDLLTLPLADSWTYFSENPNSKLSEVWQINDGILLCKGSPKGCLYLNQQMTDFILRLEWRWPSGKKPGNGGVLIRTTGQKKIWPRSLEAQLNAGQAGDFWGLDGYTFDGPASRKKILQHDQFGLLTNLKKTEDLEKPAGQWNQYEVIANGSTVVIKVNGKEVNRARDCEVISGSICLTAEGDEIHFRKLQLILSPPGGERAR